MIGKIGRAVKSIISQKTNDVFVVKDIFGHKVDERMLASAFPTKIQLYPAKVKKYPVVNVSYLLDELEELINKTKEESSVPEINDGGYTFENLYLDVIVNFAEYVHVLPASQNWHHHQAGGLLYHSLDVAYKSLRWANDNSVPRNGHIDDEVKRRPRWRYAAWLGGLLHDIGKVVTDINVFGEDGSLWDAEEQSLVEWAKDHKSKTINWEFKVNRIHKHHEVIASEMLSKIITPKAREFIKESPDDLMDKLKIVLRGYESSTGFLANAIRTADVISTQKDVQKVWENDLEQRTAAIYEQCVKAMKSLLPKWTINEKNGQVFNLGGDVYLKYPDCLDDVKNKLIGLGLNVPHTAKSLLGVLADRGIVKRDSDDSDYSMMVIGSYTKSQIIEDSQQEKGRQKIRVIRIAWPGYVFVGDVLPPSLSGYVKTSLKWDVIHYTEKTKRLYKGTELQTLEVKQNSKKTKDVSLDKNYSSSVTDKEAPAKELTIPVKKKNIIKKKADALQKPEKQKPENAVDESILRVSTPKSVIKQSHAKINNDVHKQAQLDLILAKPSKSIPSITWNKGLLSKLEVSIDEVIKECDQEIAGEIWIAIKDLVFKTKEKQQELISKLKRKGYLFETQKNPLVKKGDDYWVRLNDEIANFYDRHKEAKTNKKEKGSVKSTVLNNSKVVSNSTSTDSKRPQSVSISSMIVKYIVDNKSILEEKSCLVLRDEKILVDDKKVSEELVMLGIDQLPSNPTLIRRYLTMKNKKKVFETLNGKRKELLVIENE